MTTDKKIMLAVQETAAYADRDAYVSDMALSSIWEYGDEGEVPAERVQLLGEIWDAVHRSVPDIAAAAGMSMRKLAERFCIPYRTVENWSAGSRSCPLYVSIMMQEILGLMHRP